MIMVKISPRGSPNLQYLDMGVTGQKGCSIARILVEKTLTIVKKHTLISNRPKYWIIVCKLVCLPIATVTIYNC